MDETRNPFTPGAGTPPPELAGRREILDRAEILLKRIKKGRPSKSILLTGLRGVGKTVLLNEINRMARDLDYQTVQVEAHENKSLPALLVPHLRSLLFALNRLEGTKEKVRRALAVLRSFVSSITITYDDIPIGIDIEPEKGTADSGDLEADLPELFVIVGEAAVSRNASIVLLLDELQYLQEKELSSLIMAMHKMQQEGLPVVLIGAGLPILPRLAGESKSYAERLFDFPEIGPLPEADAALAISDPIKDEGESVTPEAVAEVVRVTQGYPYFLQEWGYQLWNLAENSPIEIDVVNTASRTTVARLDKNFFRVRYDRLTNGEKTLLRAMAELGEGPYKMGDVADVMGLKVGSLSPRRAKLINKGMIYSPQHGEVAFTVPLFDDFMRRSMPDFPPKK
ncbi:MAG: ATP-binding protein [Verrucomicrobia bacterium]|nr:ATP-binding protein [Verrucomicrobiota bacterium]